MSGMITYRKAYDLVLQHSGNYGVEAIALKSATGRILCDEAIADRNFPPFNRATKDGIALNFKTASDGQEAFRIQGILGAGARPMPLEDPTSCMEIMTGAVVPEGADTVIMYEKLNIENGYAYIKEMPGKGANIHSAGSDAEMGSCLIPPNSVITPGIMGILAAIGKTHPVVKKLPKILLISTGDELVAIDQQPTPYQIRISNTYSLHAALNYWGIHPLAIHLADDKDIIRQKLVYAMQEMDVLLISGGVSKGKFDFIPDILSELGVKKAFHNVLQRPGKPFWFGVQERTATVVFSFPGNPVSTFLCYYAYFDPWLRQSLGLPMREDKIILGQDIEHHSQLTLFISAKLVRENGKMSVIPHEGNGSGDLTLLSGTDGFIRLDSAETPYKKGTVVPFIPI